MGVEAYVGTELELFAQADHWKSYVYSMVAPYLGRTVLEVGAGLGGTTRALCRGRHDRWVCLEPDHTLTSTIERDRAAGQLPSFCEVRVGTTADLGSAETFDTILYMDVLEHIERDAEEAERAALHLRDGGRLVVLAPAHGWLFSPFDAAIGHYRRYTRRSLQAVIPANLEVETLRYLDSVGLIASSGNRFVMRSSMPNAAQVRLWDRWMVPLSRRAMDPLTGYALGKSVLGVFRRRAA